MIGKKNIVFGFLFLLFSAALGPVMVQKYDAVMEGVGEKQQTIGRLQQLAADGFEENLEPLPAGQVAKANTAGILSLNKIYNAQFEINLIRGGPHAHGNLEALLNVAAGLVLGFLAISPWIKQLISWTFILGTVLHSGMLYLGRVFQQAWAETLLATGIGPVLVLLGLLMIGLASALGRFESRVVRD